MTSSTPVAPHPDEAAAQRLAESYRQIRDEVGKVIVGQGAVIDELLISLFAGGHCLLIGVPGLAKTLMIQSLAQVLDLSFHRIQFTPDLMPADITGTEVIQEDKVSGTRAFKFLPGPIFSNFVLADEINRTPPKTQAALLEAMQEQQVTVGGDRHPLPTPFFVLATQNPIEQEGTYPLPEAQLDRFMFNVLVSYPAEDEEFRIVRQTTAGQRPPLTPVLKREELQSLQALVRQVPVADHIIWYAMQLTRATRKGIAGVTVPDFIQKYVSWGAGPRASQFLILGAKARALLQGRDFVSLDDVQAVAYPVLRHRLITNFNAEADGITPDEMIRQLIQVTPLPGSGNSRGKLPDLFESAHPGAA